MERVRADLDLVPSVFDRLIDADPGVSTEPQVHRSVRLAQLKESVKRDLEWLLNTKRTVMEIPAGLRHLHASLLTFGLPDFTHASLNRADDKRALQLAVEAAIRRFEPRLKDVVVTPGWRRASSIAASGSGSTPSSTSSRRPSPSRSTPSST